MCEKYLVSIQNIKYVSLFNYIADLTKIEINYTFCDEVRYYSKMLCLINFSKYSN